MKTTFSSHRCVASLFSGLALGVAVLLPACSGSTTSSASPSSGTVNGTVQSAPLNAQSALAFSGNVATQDNNGVVTSVRGFTIIIADKENTCSAVHLQGSTMLSLDMQGDMTVGSYPVIDPLQRAASSGEAEGDFTTADSKCASPIAEPSKKGTLTITSVDASHVTGTFDVTFADGHVTGSFDASICAPMTTKPVNGCTP
jgi:prepilin-type processing-associated H-X9-DG protein